jgi:hypothetical protein
MVLVDSLGGVLPFLELDEGEGVLVVEALFGDYGIEFAVFGEFLPELFLELDRSGLDKSGGTSMDRLVTKILWGLGFYSGYGER